MYWIDAHVAGGEVQQIDRATAVVHPTTSYRHVLLGFSCRRNHQVAYFSAVAMLAARRLPEVLRSVLNYGVDGCCLMTEEGSILAAAFTEKSSMIDTSLAAISSSIWNSISQGTARSTLSICIYISKLSKGMITHPYNAQSLLQLTGCSDVSLHLLQLESGCLGITSAGKGYILAIYGKTVPLGLLRGRLDTLSAYFIRMFEQLK